jgi:hypothetical protein
MTLERWRYAALSYSSKMSLKAWMFNGSLKNLPGFLA